MQVEEEEEVVEGGGWGRSFSPPQASTGFFFYFLLIASTLEEKNKGGGADVHRKPSVSYLVESNHLPSRSPARRFPTSSCSSSLSSSTSSSSSSPSSYQLLLGLMMISTMVTLVRWSKHADQCDQWISKSLEFRRLRSFSPPLSLLLLPVVVEFEEEQKNLSKFKEIQCLPRRVPHRRRPRPRRRRWRPSGSCSACSPSLDWSTAEWKTSSAGQFLTNFIFFLKFANFNQTGSGRKEEVGGGGGSVGWKGKWRRGRRWTCYLECGLVVDDFQVDHSEASGV